MTSTVYELIGTVVVPMTIVLSDQFNRQQNNDNYSDDDYDNDMMIDNDDKLLWEIVLKIIMMITIYL